MPIRKILAAVLGLATIGSVASNAGVLAAQKTTVKKIAVVDDAYKPSKLTIKAGQKVRWVWDSSDTHLHNVTLLKYPKGANQNHLSSTTQSSGHFQRKLTVPGTYHFICTVHLNMKLKVVVNK